MKNKIIIIALIVMIVLSVVFYYLTKSVMQTKTDISVDEPVTTSTSTGGFINKLFGKKGPTPTVLPDTRPKNFMPTEEAFNKVNYPDVFLVNHTPYESETFTVYSDYKNQPTGHFYFIVNLIGSDKNKSKQDFVNWLKELRMTDQQIAVLDIAYFDH